MKTPINTTAKYQLDNKIQTDWPVNPSQSEKNVDSKGIKIQPQDNIDVMDLDNENYVKEIIEPTLDSLLFLRQTPIKSKKPNWPSPKKKSKAKIKCLKREKTKSFVSKRLIYNEDYIHCLAFKKSKRVM